jgi:hypothetical protein
MKNQGHTNVNAIIEVQITDEAKLIDAALGDIFPEA